MTLSRSSPLSRTTGLSRTVPLQGTTELARTTRLQPGDNTLGRGAPMTRGAGLSRKPSQAQRDSWEQWADVKEAAWELWERRCVLHGHPLTWSAMHGHHRQLRSQGGPDTLANCLPLCTEAHTAAHTGGNTSYNTGLLVRSYGLAAAWPVKAWDGRTWLVTDDGERWEVASP